MLPGIERMQWFRNNIWSQEARDEEDREKTKMDEELEELLDWSRDPEKLPQVS